MLDEFQELTKKFIDAYWDIKENEQALPVDQRENMRVALLEQFNREYAILSGQDGLEQERKKAAFELELAEIEELKRLRAAEIAEEYRIKHVELTAQTELKKIAIEAEQNTKSAILKKEAEIQRDTAIECLNVKAEEMIPGDLPKRWWQRWARPNQAKELAYKKTDLELAGYFAEREGEIELLSAKNSGADDVLAVALKEQIYEALAGVRKMPRSKKKREKYEKKIQKQTDELYMAFKRLTEAQAQEDWQKTEADKLEDVIKQADDCTLADILEEMEEERRAGELSEPEEPTEPAATSDNGQLPGQIALEDLPAPVKTKRKRRKRNVAESSEALPEGAEPFEEPGAKND